MKHINKLLLVIILISAIALALPTRVSAAGTLDDKVVFGGTFTLEAGQTLDGNLAIFGGTANIEEDARVIGDVLLTGGSVNINGTVTQNVVTFGGSVFLGEEAQVDGNITTFGGVIHRSDGAEVGGEIVQGTDRPFNFDIPNRVIGPRFDFNPFWEFSTFMAQTLALAALAVLIVLAAPNASNRVAQTAFIQPVLTGGLGLLTIILAPIVIVILMITILLIPVGLIAILLLIAAAVFGYIAIGLEVGKRLMVALKGTWSLPLSAGIGTFAMGLVIGLIGLIPCFGWLLGTVVGMVGLGAVLLTRFGTQNYPTSLVIAPAAPVPPSPAAYAAPVAPVVPVQPVTPVTVVDVYPVEEPATGETPHVEVYPAPDEEDPNNPTASSFQQ